MTNLLNLLTQISENEEINLNDYYTVTFNRHCELTLQITPNDENIRRVSNLIEYLETRKDFFNKNTEITNYGNIKTIVTLKDEITDLQNTIIINLY